MLFNSPEFILVFLPLTLILFYGLAKIGVSAAVWGLLVCSLFFYSWELPQWLAILVTSIVGNFLIGRHIGKSGSKFLLIVGIAANLAVLGWFKYANFFC